MSHAIMDFLFFGLQTWMYFCYNQVVSLVIAICSRCGLFGTTTSITLIVIGAACIIYREGCVCVAVAKGSAAHTIFFNSDGEKVEHPNYYLLYFTWKF